MRVIGRVGGGNNMGVTSKRERAGERRSKFNRGWAKGEKVASKG